MKLIGMLDSPFVRRVAISAKLLGLAYEHEAVSVFRHVERFRELNPLIKAPTLICDDGGILMESSLILDYLECMAARDRKLMPEDLALRQRVLYLTGVGLIVSEKTVQRVYETLLRPAEARYAEWMDRVTQQLHDGLALLETAAKGVGDATSWLCGRRLTQADVTVAVAWNFTQIAQPEIVPAARYPALAAFCARVERQPEFVSTPSGEFK